MIISATIKCQWCGALVSIPEKKTTRAFNIALNQLTRDHDQGCGGRDRLRRKIKANEKVAANVVEGIIQRMMEN